LRTASEKVTGTGVVSDESLAALSPTPVTTISSSRFGAGSSLCAWLSCPSAGEGAAGGLAIDSAFWAAGGAAAEFVAELLEILLGPRSGGGGLGDALLVEGFGRPLHLLAGLLELLAFVGHSFGVFWRFHARLKLLGVLEDLPLLVLEALELAFELFTLLLCAGFFEGGLQLFQPLVEIVLPLGELFQAIEDLAIFALLGRFILILSLALGFVAVFFVF